ALVGLLAAGAFAHGGPRAVVAGLLLYVVAVVLDHADGEVARLTLGESRLGEWLDLVADMVVHGALVVALGVGAARVAGAGLTAGLVGAAGVVVSSLLAKAVPPRPGRGLLDDLSSRDGFYSMLAAFVLVRLAAPALLPALMVFVALGAHTYWVARTLSLRRRKTWRTPK
ncbi:MAG TPA: CDP-alcohol phosphatidyltransferase family protein, partial [Methylomirabilota bacterium]|nr:CDP-alcohol phosphatidyltransferase family protein [Methylomirabilota bacterium]